MFTGITKRAYLAWLSHDTWHSGHQLDMKRFYHFVHCYVVYARKPIGSSFIYQDLVERKFGKSTDKIVQGVAHKFASLFDELVDFERQLRKNDWGPLPEFKNGHDT